MQGTALCVKLQAYVKAGLVWYISAELLHDETIPYSTQTSNEED